MFCVKCGRKLPDNVEFCIYCGAKLPSKPKPAAPPEEAAPASGSATTVLSNSGSLTYEQPQQQAQQAQNPQPAQPGWQQQAAGQQTAQQAAGQQTAGKFHVNKPQGQQAQPQYANAQRQERPSGTAGQEPDIEALKKQRAKKIAIPVCIGIAAVAIVIAGFMTGWFGLAKKGSGVEVKGSTEEYSWEELSSIAGEISDAKDEDAALKVAEKYNLCSDDGKLDGTQTKSLTLSDGTETSVEIVGFYHDDKSDGSGKAGITFMFADAPTAQAINSTDANAGGWEKSAIRNWLSFTFSSELPSELADAIVAVDKNTNNTGAATDASAVTTTSDKLWLFSPIEIGGNIAWFTDDAAPCNDIMNAEGSEYQLFSDLGVVNTEESDALKRSTAGEDTWWWTRTPHPLSDDKFQDVAGGCAEHSHRTTLSAGIVPGFCL